MMEAPYRQMARLFMGSTAAPDGLVGGGCSGAFYGPRQIITAGHCFKNAFRFYFPKIIVNTGASGLATNYVEISSTFFYFGRSRGTDIAVVILSDTRKVANHGWFGYEDPAAFSGGSGPIMGMGDGIQIFGYPATLQPCNTYNTNPAGLVRPGFRFVGCLVVQVADTSTTTIVNFNITYPTTILSISPAMPPRA
jgi:Trypsin